MIGQRPIGSIAAAAHRTRWVEVIVAVWAVVGSVVCWPPAVFAAAA